MLFPLPRRGHCEIDKPQTKEDEVTIGGMLATPSSTQLSPLRLSSALLNCFQRVLQPFFLPGII